MQERSKKTTTSHPSFEQIARRAYEIYLARGGVHGRDREDWAQAEWELMSETKSKTADTNISKGLRTARRRL